MPLGYLNIGQWSVRDRTINVMPQMLHRKKSTGKVQRASEITSCIKLKRKVMIISWQSKATNRPKLTQNLDTCSLGDLRYTSNDIHQIHVVQNFKLKLLHSWVHHFKDDKMSNMDYTRGILVSLSCLWDLVWCDTGFWVNTGRGLNPKPSTTPYLVSRIFPTDDKPGIEYKSQYHTIPGLQKTK